jgi:ribosomal protein S19E (S16A)
MMRRRNGGRSNSGVRSERGRRAGGKLVVVVLEHLAEVAHVEHVATEGAA